MKKAICIVDCAYKTAKDIILSQKEALFELRLDRLFISLEEFKSLLEISKNYIITYRPNKFAPNRKDFFDLAMKAKVSYIDLDHDDELLDYVRENKIDTEIIYSYHNFEKVVDERVLEDIISNSSDTDILKIACQVNSEEDLERLLSLYTKKEVQSRKLTIIAMGDQGRISRENADELGAYIMYYAHPDLHPSAPGQLVLSKDEVFYLEKEYNLAVVGNPILHSKSPELFSELSQANNVITNYSRIAAVNAEDAFYLMEQLNLDGLNITAPFKEDFHGYKEIELSDLAESIYSLNTIYKKKERYFSESTDVYGVKRSIEEYQKENEILFDICFIIGAGGAGRAAFHAVKELGIETKLYNRNPQSHTFIGKYNIHDLEDLKNDCRSVSNKKLLIINTSPINIEEQIKDSHSNSVLFNAVYKSGDNSNISPLSWLIYQGVQSFKLFTGITPIFNYSKVIDSLRNDKLIKDRIYLIGFMGSGKTSVGKSLAAKLDYKFIDLDLEIEKTTGKSIPQIFEEDGERYFRYLEYQEYMKTKKFEKTIIACGGGIIENSDVFCRKSANECVVYLYSSFEVCKNRIENSNRPLNDESMKERFDKRNHLYFKASDLIVKTENTIDYISDRLFNEIKIYNK